ncbi:TPR-like protein [Neoconidiobolus thromboides FSU 785]|nr:TPR-like protein [Neoconidiobolus thromboides FSU 785]
MDYESDEEIRELLEEEIEGGWEYDELIPSDNETSNNNKNTQLFQHPFLNNEKVEEIKEMGENEDIGEEGEEEEEHILRGDQIEDGMDEEEVDKKEVQEEEENLEEEDIEGIESLMNKIKENISQDNLMDINNDREVVSWQVFNSEISTLKDDLAITSSVGTKGGKKLGRRVRGGKKGGRRKNTSRNREISPEIKFMLGEVNYYYIQQEYSSALKILFNIVKMDPTIYEAWFVMGLIYEDCEFKVKALNVLFIAAYISQNDNALWKKVARLSKDEDLLEQASYCYSKAILSDKTDIEAMKEKAELAIEMDYLYTAIHNYKQILKITPYNLELMNDLILLIVKNEGDLTEAIPYIDEAILQHLTNEEFKGELKYCYLNIATDVYLLNGQYIKALRRIIRGCYCISETNWNEWNESAHSLESLIEITSQFLYFDLPIEIKMKIGTLLALLNLDLEAEEYFKYLLLLDANIYFNTFIEVGKALITKNKVEKGLDILLYLEQNCNETVNVELLIIIGEGFEKLNEDEKAIEYYLKGKQLNFNVRISTRCIFY